MPTVRQLASGLVYAIVSLLLVIGSLSLSLAQGRRPAAPSALPTLFPSFTDTSRPTSRPTIDFAPSATSSAMPSATPVAPTSTYLFPPITATIRAPSTAVRPCGPYAGWVRGYVVQQGDTLFRIATMHGTGVEALQRANCKTGTIIYVGELLWIPFVLPALTEPTIIPTFDTPTEPATPEVSDTPTATLIESPDP